MNITEPKKKFKFAHLKSFLWPIERFELVKFVPMCLLMFTILMNQNIVRGIKDCIVMTMVGPEVISFIKLWGELPAGVLFVILYSFLCNKISTERLFQIIVAFFLLFFAIFAYIIYPNYEYFHPDPVRVAHYVALYPHVKWFIIMGGKWSFVLFYILGELWPIIVFSLLFWQLANKITKTEEAGRFYSLFTFFGQSSLIFSGNIMKYFSKEEHFLSFFFGNLCPRTEITIKSLMLIVIITGIICLLIHRFICKTVMTNPTLYAPIVRNETLKLSLRESLKMIINSRYLGLIAVILLCYSMSVNLIEGLWLSKARELYKTFDELMTYQGKVLIWTGVSTLVFAFLGGTIIRKGGWFVGAVISPLMFFFAGGIFFIFALFQDNLALLFPIFSPLGIIVFVGALQNILGKGTKYSLFDTTKEMAYIPLDIEMKTKGKAAVDIVASKIGKSSGAIIQFLVFTISPASSYCDVAGFLAFMFFFVCILWIWGLFKLSKDYKQLLEKSNS